MLNECIIKYEHMHFMWKCPFSLKDICKRTRVLYFRASNPWPSRLAAPLYAALHFQPLENCSSTSVFTARCPQGSFPPRRCPTDTDALSRTSAPLLRQESVKQCCSSTMDLIHRRHKHLYRIISDNHSQIEIIFNCVMYRPLHAHHNPNSQELPAVTVIVYTFHR